MYDVITIERRYASGGHEIGKKLAEALGYKLYDRCRRRRRLKYRSTTSKRLRRAVPAIS